jgi:hypothetical protein
LGSLLALLVGVTSAPSVGQHEIRVVKILTKAPADCGNLEIGVFIAAVRAAEEVSMQGLVERIRNSAALAFAYEDGALAGVSALKRPQASYRRRIGTASGVALPEQAFPFELGWVYVLPDSRGKRLSLALCKAVLSESEGSGVFATSRLDNEPMHKSLFEVGFRQRGKPYASGRGKHELAVFIRDAAQ